MEDEFKEVNFDELNLSDLKDDKANDWTWEKNYNFRDPVVSRVVKQFVDRSNTGYEKYGKTLDSERREGIKDLGDYLKDIQEELMDAVLYIQAAREDLENKPQCKCQVKDVNNKTTLGDLKALEDLKIKMDAKKQVTYDKDNFGYTKEFYGNDFVSNHT